jgi:ligand-binding sensor domain-containing protein
VSAPALLAALLFTGNVAALATDGQRLFIGAFDQGVFERTADGAVTKLVDPALNRNVNALLVDRARTHLYVATARGTVRCRIASHRCERLGGRDSMHALAELEDGTVLAGGDGGVVAFRGDRVTEFSRKKGAPFRAVWALAQASDGTVFVGATNGVHYAPASVFAGESGAGLTMARAAMVTGDLPDDWVTALAVDGESLHVGTYNSGVTSFRALHGALARTSEATALGYVNPAGIVAVADGRLAVATMDGLRVGGGSTWATVQTDVKDVTSVLAVPGTGMHWVATRHGVVAVQIRQ